MNNYLILLFGLILILLIVFINGYYKNEVKEGLQNMKNQIKDEEKHTRVNPLYNVMLNDYTDNPKKEAASTEYNEEKEELINHQVKNFIYENNCFIPSGHRTYFVVIKTSFGHPNDV